MSETISDFHSQLSAARIARNINEIDAAKMLGLSIHEYWDLEHYKDEWITVVPAIVIRCAVSFYGLNWAACHIWPEGRVQIDRKQPVNDFIRELRTKTGLSRQEFADRVGFFEALSEVIEGHEDGLALWPIGVAILLAKEFDADSRLLVERLIHRYPT